MKVTVKVTPNSMQDLIKEAGVNSYGNRVFKVRTVATSQDGKANEAVIKILSEYFKVRRGDVRIISGETARLKIVEIDKKEVVKEEQEDIDGKN